jgi:hypothetical protein
LAQVWIADSGQTPVPLQLAATVSVVPLQLDGRHPEVG